MAVHVLPDVERLVIDWALSDAALTTALDPLVDGRIYGVVPAAPVFPLVRVMRVGGSPSSRLLWLDEALLQVDVWGGPKATARLAAETLRAHMAASLPGGHALGIVSAVELGALSWLPDDSYVPSKPRYSFDVTVTYHP